MDGITFFKLKLAVDPNPNLPTKAEAKSDSMSACKLVATITSNFSGVLTIKAVAASTKTIFVFISGYFFFIS